MLDLSGLSRRDKTRDAVLNKLLKYNVSRRDSQRDKHQSCPSSRPPPFLERGLGHWPREVPRALAVFSKHKNLEARLELCTARHVQIARFRELHPLKSYFVNE